MTERIAWFCPSCQRHHAPHVETCPAPVDAISTKEIAPFAPRPFYPRPGSAADVPRYLTGIYNPPTDPNIMIRNGTALAGDGGTVWGPQ